MSLKVNSEEIKFLFIEYKIFLERFYNPHPWLKHLLCERLELQK